MGSYQDPQEEYAAEAGKRTRIAIKAALMESADPEMFITLAYWGARSAHRYWTQLEAARSLNEDIGQAPCRYCGHQEFDHTSVGFCSWCLLDCPEGT